MTALFRGSIPMLATAFLIYLVAANVETLFLHVRYGGNLKRGIGIWTEKVPADMVRFLRRLPNDYLDGDTGAFIRKKEKLVLIQAMQTRPWWAHFASQLKRAEVLPYIATVDLSAREPRFNYRVPLFSLPLLAFWIMLALLARLIKPVLVLILVLGVLVFIGNHARQRRHIRAFIKRAMKAQVENKSVQKT